MSDLALDPHTEGFRLTEAQRNEIIAKRLAGIEAKSIAEQYNVDQSTIWRVCNSVQKAVAAHAQDWRAEQAQLAVQSVNRALIDDSDTYKSAGIAVQALKGLGVYQADNSVQLNVANWLGSRPAGADTAVQELELARTARVKAQAVVDTSEEKA
jgi:hypothetical protein